MVLGGSRHHRTGRTHLRSSTIAGHTIEVQPPTRGRKGRTHRSSTTTTSSKLFFDRFFSKPPLTWVSLTVCVPVRMFELVARQNRFELNSGSNLSKK